MSSKIEIQKICEYCGNEFLAKTTVTRYCSHKCNQRDYKLQLKNNKVEKAVEATAKQKIALTTGINIEIINHKDFLSIKEAYTLLGLSERTFYRLMKSGTINSTKIGNRTIIQRTEINKLFAS